MFYHKTTSQTNHQFVSNDRFLTFVTPFWSASHSPLMASNHREFHRASWQPVAQVLTSCRGQFFPVIPMQNANTYKHHIFWDVWISPKICSPHFSPNPTFGPQKSWCFFCTHSFGAFELHSPKVPSRLIVGSRSRSAEWATPQTERCNSWLEESMLPNSPRPELHSFQFFHVFVQLSRSWFSTLQLVSRVYQLSPSFYRCGDLPVHHRSPRRDGWRPCSHRWSALVPSVFRQKPSGLSDSKQLHFNLPEEQACFSEPKGGSHLAPWFWHCRESAAARRPSYCYSCCNSAASSCKTIWL